MLVAFGASIARDAGDTVFTGTLARGLVTGLAGGAHGMAIALCGGNTQQEVQGERRAGAGGLAAAAGSGASAAGCRQLLRHDSTFSAAGAGPPANIPSSQRPH